MQLLLDVRRAASCESRHSALDGRRVASLAGTIDGSPRTCQTCAWARLRRVGYFLGIDGGQTTSRAALVSADGQLVRVVEAGGLVHILSPGGRAQVSETLAHLRDRATTGGERVDAAFLALTGVDAGAPSQTAAREIATRLWPDAHVAADNDGLAAWAGGTGARPGAAAMAGTGSVVVAVNESGEVIRTGGWGYLFGDAGGGWQIGTLAIRAMLRRADRGEDPSPLDRLLLHGLGAATPSAVPRDVYAGAIRHVQVARLAEPIARAAAGGDPNAHAVLAVAAADFADDVAAALQRVAWATTPVRVAMVGRIFQAGAAYQQPFRQALARRARVAVELTAPVLSNLGGAVLLAMRLAGAASTDMLCQRLASQDLEPD